MHFDFVLQIIETLKEGMKMLLNDEILIILKVVDVLIRLYPPIQQWFDKKRKRKCADGNNKKRYKKTKKM